VGKIYQRFGEMQSFGGLLPRVSLGKVEAKIKPDKVAGPYIKNKFTTN
jgi:hypothetical protein